MFPANGSVTRHSLPSTGFPRVEFPCFIGTTKCSDFPPLVRPRFGIPSLGRTSPCACVRSHGPDAGPGPGALGLAAPRQKLRKGNDGTSQVPGESSCAYAVFFDPGRTDTSGHTTESARPPYWQRRRLPRIYRLSRLNRTACALAVYASPWGLLHPDARLASRCCPLYGTGLVTRRIPTKGFRVASYISSSFPKLS